MPLIDQLSINNHSRAAIWKIEEPEMFFADSTGIVTPIAHEKRRTEHLAGRYLLQLLAPGIALTDIVKDEHEKPRLPGNSLFFSISHSWPFVAAIISDSAEAGIDIQTFHSRINHIKDRFLSGAEQDMLFNDPAHFLLAWSAKEAAYKWNGRREVSFKEQLPIMSFSENNTMRINVIRETENFIVELDYLLNAEFACAFVSRLV